MLKIASFDIVFQEIPGEVTLALNLSNCPCHCPGCHSKHLWEDIGEELNEELLDGFIARYGSMITCVCFMGGDQAPEEVIRWAEYIKGLSGEAGLKVAWYSGRPHLPECLSAKRSVSASGLSATRSVSEAVFIPVTDPYSGNMSIIARVMNGDEAVHGVEVGVFAGDECRGAATEEHINENTTDGYWFLTVAGDEATQLTIKVYDPTTGETITVQQTLTYTDDATLGSLDEPYIIQLNAAEGIEDVQGNGSESL